MMKRILQISVSLALLVALSGTAAQAATRKKAKAPATSAPRNLTVELPEADFSKSISTQDGLEEKSSRPVEVGFALGYWSPSDFRPSSQLADTQAFSADGSPSMALTFQTPISAAASRLGNLNFRMGAGFSVLQRQGSLRAGAATLKAEQTLYLFPIPVGLQFNPRLWRGDAILPFVQAALLPTIGVSPRSALQERVVSLGLPMELGAGLSGESPAWVSEWMSGLKSHWTAGVRMTAGTFLGASMLGFGAQAGLQVGI